MNEPIIWTSEKDGHILDFNPKTHRYYLKKAGEDRRRPVVSVTTIKRGFPQSEALIKWRVAQGMEEYIAGGKLEKAGDIGNLAHELYPKVEKGEKFEAPQIPELQNILRLHGEWYEKRGKYDDVQGREVIMAHPQYMVGGTLDRYVIRDGKMGLQDYKSGKSIYDSDFFQLAWYDILAEFWLGVRFDFWEIIRFGKEDDEPDTKKLSDPDIMRDFREQTIRNLQTYRFMVKYKP